MATLIFVLAFLLLVAIVVIILDVEQIKQVRAWNTMQQDEIERLHDVVTETKANLRLSNVDTHSAFIAAAPLLEKTNWSLYSHASLVLAEEGRNEMIDRARKALHEIPAVENWLKTNQVFQTYPEHLPMPMKASQ